MESIHPRNGLKYSPNLFNWLIPPAHNGVLNMVSVRIDPYGVRRIGYFAGEAFRSSLLLDVFDQGPKAPMNFIIGRRRFVPDADFWARYIQDGRCAVDAAHIQELPGDESRWGVSADGSSRRCMWCSKSNQVLRRWNDGTNLTTWENQASIES